MMTFSEPIQTPKEVGKPFAIAASPPIFVDYMDDDLE
jgi:hypothetical protein